MNRLADLAKAPRNDRDNRAARLFAWFSAPLRHQPAAIRARLLETTYDRKFAILFASLSVLILAGTTIILTGAWWPWLWIAADLALLAYRFTLIRRCEAARQRGEDPPLGALMAAGGTWSIIFGLGCFGCVASENLVLSVLAALNVAGVIGVVSSRNAATPRYAILVMLAVVLPFMFGALFSPSRGMMVVGLQLPFYVAGIIGVLVHNHAISVRMIRAEFDNRDGFKHINDSYGHAAGDRLLRRVGERLTNTFRATDMVFRIGGDEFIVLLPTTSEIEAAHLARRAIETIAEPFDIEVVTTVYVGLSIGSARAPVDGDTPEGLLTCSDLALYEAKRAGKGRHRAHLSNAC